ncbi:MAG TPA: hypothetical protein VLA88_03320 [Candidatus Saccharimonadales bacterium]|nr:hypothetical protein [Candidatus Saccharimonadales bacterium]
MTAEDLIGEARSAVDEAASLGDDELSRIDLLLCGARAYLREAMIVVTQRELSVIRSLFRRISELYHKPSLRAWVATQQRAALPA